MLIDSDKLIRGLENRCENITRDVKNGVVKDVYKIAYRHVIEFIEIQPEAYNKEGGVNE